MFTLTIETGNAAFDPDPAPEVARLLRQVVHAVESGYDTKLIRDENGNTVGSWVLTLGDEPAAVSVSALQSVHEAVGAALGLLSDPDDPEGRYSTDLLSEAERVLTEARATLSSLVSDAERLAGAR